MTKQTKNEARATETDEAKVERWLRRAAGYARERFDELKTELAREIEDNPVYAVEWKAKKVVDAQTTYEVWLAVERDLDEGEPVTEVLAENIGTVERLLEYAQGDGSTCPYQRANERVKGQVYVRELRKLREAAQHLEVE